MRKETPEPSRRRSAPPPKAESPLADAGATGSTGDRAATERLLESAALELMSEHGVLSGLNLREVADRVGANRGLVYHYFRDRRGLLRSALRRRGSDIEPEVHAGSDSPFFKRTVDQIRAVARNNGEYIRLLTLLVLDGDPGVKVLPLQSWSAQLLQADRERGDLPEDADLEAIQVLISSLTVGYSLLRQKFSEELKIAPADLDRRFWTATEKVLAALSR